MTQALPLCSPLGFSLQVSPQQNILLYLTLSSVSTSLSQSTFMSSFTPFISFLCGLLPVWQYQTQHPSTNIQFISSELVETISVWLLRLYIFFNLLMRCPSHILIPDPFHPGQS